MISGFSKMGLPILIIPSEKDFPQHGSSSFSTMQDSDLLILFKYYLAVIPR